MNNEQKIESRTYKFAKNISFTMIQKLIDIFVTFVLRTIFIKTLGVTYLGINSLFSNILTILSLMELGVGSAIVFSLYKPIAERDNRKIASLMNLYKNVYTLIGIAICVVGLALTPFLKYIINVPQSIDGIYIIYCMTIINTAVAYFFSYKRSLLIADQQSNISTRNLIIFKIIRFVGLSLALVFTRNYIVYLAVDIINTLASNIHISKVTDKIYAEILQIKALPLNKEEKKDIVKYMSAVMASKVGQTVVMSTDSIIISAFISTVMVGYYTNYCTITFAIDALEYTFFSILTPSVGNYSIENDERSSEKLFKVISMVNYMVSFCISIGILCLISPFIHIWLGEEYILPELTVILLSINYFLTSNVNCVSNFMDSNGKLSFKNRYRGLVEAGINIVVSIILVKYTNLGISGVLLGTTICFLCGRVWMDARVLYKYCFHKPLSEYIKRYALRFILLVIIAMVLKAFSSICFNQLGISLFSWILIGTICVVASIMVLVFTYRRTDEWAAFISLVCKLFNFSKLK